MNRKKVAVLLHGPVRHDGRVIKMLRTISRWASVDFFYMHGREEDRSLFNPNVRLFSPDLPSPFLRKCLRHSFFYREFDFMTGAVLKTGVRYDVIYCNDLPTLRPGLQLKRKLGSRLIYDSHEIYIETINQFFPKSAGGIKGGIFKFLIRFMRRVGRKFEARAIREADSVITVNDSLASYFFEEYQLRTRPVVIYNCPDRQFRESAPRKRKEELNRPEDGVILIYQGVLNEGRGLRLMIRAMKELDARYHLLIVGEGPLKKELLNLREELRLDTRVHFTGRVSYQGLSSYTRSADIGLNLLENTNLSKSMALANKLFEYIHSGLPVLSTNTPEHQKIYGRYEIGVLINNNVEEIKEGIESIWKKHEDFTSALNEARNEFNWENQEPRLYEALGFVTE